MKTETIVINFIRNNNIKKFVEIGVEYGKMLSKVLPYIDSEIDEYWAVDPWEPVGLKYGPKLGYRTKTQWHELYTSICQKMTEFKSLKVVKLPSVEAAAFFPDDYLDMIYIDADHCYLAVHDDLHAWYRKVRIGGIISGHDYNIKSVKQAVDEFFGFELGTVPDNTKVWMTRKDRFELPVGE